MLNPHLWEDKNDWRTLSLYKEKINAKSIYALCLTYKSETFHHWNAFANGPSGCCIEFDFDYLTYFMKSDSIEVKHGKVEYKKLSSLNSSLTPISNELLPFVKRHPFEHENEYRIILISHEEQKDSFDIPITTNIIRKITLTNKLNKNVFESIKNSLLLLDPTLIGKINRSSLFDNDSWTKYFINL